MAPPPQSELVHRRHQQPAEKLSQCIKYIKSPDGGGFRTFGDFMAGLFTELPTDSSSANDSAYQTIRQTVRTFLKWNPLKGFLDKLSSHTAMTENDKNTQGIVPFYCVSPGLPVSEGMVLLLHYQCSSSHICMEVMAWMTTQLIQLAVESFCAGHYSLSWKKLTRRLRH